MIAEYLIFIINWYMSIHIIVKSWNWNRAAEVSSTNKTHSLTYSLTPNPILGARSKVSSLPRLKWNLIDQDHSDTRTRKILVLEILSNCLLLGIGNRSLRISRLKIHARKNRKLFKSRFHQPRIQRSPSTKAIGSKNIGNQNWGKFRSNQCASNL